jgi:hypothetical protein
VIATNNVLGIHGMLAAGHYSDVLRVVSLVAVASLILAPASIILGGKIGLAALTVGIETAVCLSYYRRLRCREIL